MRVHYLQHVHFEGLGSIENWMNDNGHTISSTHFYKCNYLFPDLSAIDVLIVMGGPMGVYDEEQFSWLKQEKAFIKSCIQCGKKVLGVCLGAQLIAACLGAEVDHAQNMEIGWFTVSRTEASKDLRWFYDLFINHPVVFHWHGDQFEIPEGSVNLLYSEANTNQAFCYNGKIIGLQFHLEVTTESLALMIENGFDELLNNSPYVQTKEELLSYSSHIIQCNELVAKILSYWMNC